MSLSLSKKSSLIAQSEIRTMTIACAKIGGINLAQGVCDTEVPLPVRRGAEEAIDAGINSGYHVNTILAVGAVPVYVRLNPPDYIFHSKIPL